jgi:uncharacterized protein (UPF0371 family)
MCFLCVCLHLQEVVALQQELDQSAAKVAENQNLVKTIEAVIDYRATKRQAEQLQAQIGVLTQQIGEVGDDTQVVGLKSQGVGAYGMCARHTAVLTR